MHSKTRLDCTQAWGYFLYALVSVNVLFWKIKSVTYISGWSGMTEIEQQMDPATLIHSICNVFFISVFVGGKEQAR